MVQAINQISHAVGGGVSRQRGTSVNAGTSGNGYMVVYSIKEG